MKQHQPELPAAFIKISTIKFSNYQFRFTRSQAVSGWNAHHRLLIALGLCRAHADFCTRSVTIDTIHFFGALDSPTCTVIVNVSFNCTISYESFVHQNHIWCFSTRHHTCFMYTIYGNLSLQLPAAPSSEISEP